MGGARLVNILLSASQSVPGVDKSVPIPHHVESVRARCKQSLMWAGMGCPAVATLP